MRKPRMPKLEYSLEELYETEKEVVDRFVEQADKLGIPAKEVMRAARLISANFTNVRNLVKAQNYLARNGQIEIEERNHSKRRSH